MYKQKMSHVYSIFQLDFLAPKVISKLSQNLIYVVKIRYQIYWPKQTSYKVNSKTKNLCIFPKCLHFELFSLFVFFYTKVLTMSDDSDPLSF